MYYARRNMAGRPQRREQLKNDLRARGVSEEALVGKSSKELQARLAAIEEGVMAPHGFDVSDLPGYARAAKPKRAAPKRTATKAKAVVPPKGFKPTYGEHDEVEMILVINSVKEYRFMGDLKEDDSSVVVGFDGDTYSVWVVNPFDMTGFQRKRGIDSQAVAEQAADKIVKASYKDLKEARALEREQQDLLSPTARYAKVKAAVPKVRASAPARSKARGLRMAFTTKDGVFITHAPSRAEGDRLLNGMYVPDGVDVYGSFDWESDSPTALFEQAGRYHDVSWSIDGAAGNKLYRAPMDDDEISKRFSFPVTTPKVVPWSAVSKHMTKGRDRRVKAAADGGPPLMTSAELVAARAGYFDSVLSITGATERTYVIPKGKQGYLNVHGQLMSFDNGMTGADVKETVDKVLKFIGGHSQRFIESIEYTGRLYRDEPEWVVHFGS